MGVQGVGSGNVPPKGPSSVGKGSKGGPPTPPSKPDPATTEAYISQVRDWLNNGGSAQYTPKQPSADSFAKYYLDTLNDQASGSSPDLSAIISNVQKVIIKPDDKTFMLATIMGQSLSTYEGISSALSTAMVHLNEANSQLTQIVSYAKNLQSQIAGMKDGPAKTQAQADLTKCQATITKYQAAITTLSAQAKSDIEPFMTKFEGQWGKMMTDFNSYVKTPSDALYQQIGQEHNDMPPWLTADQTAFVQGNSQTGALGVNQVFYGLSGLENALINVDREIHGGSAPTPTPWPGPSTKPKPPTGNNITNGTVIDFIRDVQQWLGVGGASKFSKVELQFVSQFLNNEANKANGTYDQTSLKAILSSVNLIALNPTKTVLEGINEIAKFNVSFGSYSGAIAGIINRMPMMEAQIAQDLASIKKFEKAAASTKDPATKKKILAQLQAAQDDLNKCEASLKSCESQKSYLSGLLSNAKGVNTQMQAAWEKFMTSTTTGARKAALSEMHKLAKEIPAKLDSKAKKVQTTMKNLSTSISTDEDNIVAARKMMTNYPPPPKLPPGQMYLQSNELQGILAKGTSPAKMKAAIDAYLAELSKENIDTLNLAFTQLNDIEKFINGTKISGATPDTLVQWINDNPSAWKTFETEANAKGFKLDFSFGGQNAQAADWALPAGQGAQMAQALIQKLTVNGKLMVQKFDFDVELQGFANGDMANLKAFFTQLHTSADALGGQTLLTSMGSVTDWVESNIGGKITKGPLYDLFFDDQGNPAFSKMFDGLNLMMYSQTDYYLDASNKDGDSIEDWINLIGKQNVGMIHLGFEDNVPYTAGHNPVWAPTEGQAAAMQYERLLTQLQKDGYIDSTHQLGGPFFWPDSNINSSADFPHQDFEQDFYNELDRWNWLNR